MEEKMISWSNIMPVKLAIRRELEYRAKLEESKNQKLNDLKPLVIPQDPPRSQSQPMKEDAEVAPSNSQKPSMLQFSSSSSHTMQEKPAFSCKACQLTFSSVFDLTSHIGSQHHKVNISQMKQRREAISNPILCELCKSSCSSLVEVEAHLMGAKHNSSVSKLVKNGKRKR